MALPDLPRIHTRIARLAALLGLDLDARYDAVYQRFGAYLRHFSELGVQLREPAVAALSFGTDAEFRDAIRDHLVADGHGPESLATLDSLQRGIDAWMVARIQVVGRHVGPTGLYFRKAMPLDRCFGLLSAHGASEAAVAQLREQAILLRTETSQVFAAHLQPGAAPLFKVYFRHGFTDLDLLREALDGTAASMDLDARHRVFLAEHLRELCGHSRASLLVSFYVREGELDPTIKLDAFRVDAALLDRVLRAANYLDAGEVGPAQVAQAADARTIEHFGVALGRTPTPGLSLYLSGDES
jgi:hypothetical protein